MSGPGGRLEWPAWRKRLTRKGALLFPCAAGGWAVYPGGDRRRRPLARIGAEAVRGALEAGLLAPEGEGYRLVREGECDGAGRAALDGPDRRPDWSRTKILVGGKTRDVTCNQAHSPLWRWRKSGAISTLEFAAGEKLREDYHRSSLNPRLVRDYGGARVEGGRLGGPEEASLSALAAKDRVIAALEACGEGLDELISAVCLREEALDLAAARLGWPRAAGAAQTALRLALKRLAVHYGLAPRRRVSV